MLPSDVMAKLNDFLKYSVIGIFVLGLISFFVIIGLVITGLGFLSLPPSECVGVVEITGDIMVGGTPPSLMDAGTLGSDEIAERIRALDKRDDVKAVLFVVNSPGGSVVGTSEIYDAVVELEKPQVAYFREVAASGAYYLSAPSDYIISSPQCLTGSIGVIATLFQMEELFDNLGVNISTIKAGEHKDMGSISREMTDEEKEILQTIVDEIYSDFKSVILEHRGSKLDMKMFDEITDGRVLSGKQAKEVGLVDELGNKRDALEKAAELGGITYEGEVPVCEINTAPEEFSIFEVFSFIKQINSHTNNQVYLEYR